MSRTDMDGQRRLIDIHIGFRLRQARESSAITQEKLANAMNISLIYLQECERGNRRLDAVHLHDACNFLGIGIGVIFSGSPVQSDGVLILQP